MGWASRQSASRTRDELKPTRPPDPSGRRRKGPRVVRDLQDIVPDALNANRGTTRGRQALTVSLEECGFGRSLVLDQDGRIIAGHQTWAIAKALGLPLRVIQSDGQEVI